MNDSMTLDQHEQIGGYYRRLAMHELARGYRRLALRYFELAHKHESQAFPVLAAA